MSVYYESFHFLPFLWLISKAIYFPFFRRLGISWLSAHSNHSQTRTISSPEFQGNTHGAHPGEGEHQDLPHAPSPCLSTCVCSLRRLTRPRQGYKSRGAIFLASKFSFFSVIYLLYIITAFNLL